MSTVTKPLYQFGAFRIDSVGRVLLRDGEPVPLAPKAFDTLLILVQNRGRVLDKDELMALLWPDSEVEEANLPQNISLLRKALGESPNERRYVITIPGRGYRFGADVQEFEDDQEGPDLVVAKYTKSTILIQDEESSPQPATRSLPAADSDAEPRGRILAAAAGVGALIVLAAVAWLSPSKKPGSDPPPLAIKTLAVLPFKLLGPEGDEYLGPGIADSLITTLSNLREVKVRPTSSVMKYAGQTKQPTEAGRELGVEAVLEGSIQRAGDNLRVTVQLVRVDDGLPLWAEKFDDKVTDILKIEDSISNRVAGSLIMKLSGEQRTALAKRYTQNIEAYQLYLKGIYFINKGTPETVRKGIGYFEQAIQLDQKYALAYAGLAQAYCRLPITSDFSSAEVLPKARDAATRALELDDRLADAHAALANVKFWMEWDWPGVEKECRRAIELNPNYVLGHFWYAQLLGCVGRHSEAIAEQKRALELDPLSPMMNLFLGHFLYLAGQYDQAARRLNDALEIDPSHWLAHLFAGKVYVQLKKYDEAIAEFQKARELSAGNSEALSSLGHALAASGQQNEARRVLEQMKDPSKRKTVSPYGVALIYVGLGEKDHAFEWLEKAYQERDVRMILLKVEPKWSVLGVDPRFTSLLQRLRLSD
jgi:DNA-binding winged helix-turn-helix (wHTH) protein/TolB-like protein/Tfp pilus assembly protein PilF